MKAIINMYLASSLIANTVYMSYVQYTEMRHIDISNKPRSITFIKFVL